MVNPIFWFFREIFFRPLFNFLVLIYNLLPAKDMGVSVIIFVIIMQILLLPLKKASRASEPDRDKVMEELEKAKQKYRYNALAYRRAEQEIIKKHRKTFNIRLIDLFIEGIYFAMLWRIFGVTLPDRHWEYLYTFVPIPPEPLNLHFLNILDLSKVSLTLNTITAVGLFVVLFFHNLFKATKASKYDYIIMVTAPFGAYFITMFVPSGDEFFFGLSETIELLLIFNDQFKKIYKKLGFKEDPVKLTDFVSSAKKQISGQ